MDKLVHTHDQYFLAGVCIPQIKDNAKISTVQSIEALLLELHSTTMTMKTKIKKKKISCLV